VPNSRAINSVESNVISAVLHEIRFKIGQNPKRENANDNDRGEYAMIVVEHIRKREKFGEETSVS
jgi:hypothetical protein